MVPGFYRRATYILLVTFICSLRIFAQESVQKLKAYYDELDKAQLLNGTLLVAENGTPLYDRSFGYADFENRILNTSTTRFELASVSKTFTAVAVMQLVETGKVELDSFYAFYFPQFPYKQATIRQMLSHSSGLSDHDLSFVFDRYKKTHTGKQIRNADLVEILAEANTPLKLKPGQKWWYCNLAYQLLALLVEKQSGLSFDKYLEQYIWKPAGMNDTYLKTALLNTGTDKQKAENYDYLSSFDTVRSRFKGELSYYTDALFGPSSVISTTGDLLRYDKALYSDVLLRSSTKDLCFSPSTLQNGEPNRVWLDIGSMGKAINGLGWFIFEDTSMGKIVWHAGGMPGCATIFFRNLSKNQTVILLDNTSSEKLYRKGLSAMRILNGLPPLPAPSSLKRIYARELYSKGAVYAEQKLMRLKSDTLHYVLTESDLNNLGYEFREKKHLPLALKVFELATRLYPQSDNLFNSYAEALEAAGQKEKAIRMYQKSLALNPENEESAKALKKLGINQ